MAALNAWYASPEYQPLIALRQAAALDQLITIEGTWTSKLHPALHNVQGAGDELLVSLACATGPSGGTRCTPLGAAVAALSVRR